MQVPEAGPGCPEGTSGSPSWGEGVVLLVPTWALSCRHARGGPCRLMGMALTRPHVQEPQSL